MRIAVLVLWTVSFVFFGGQVAELGSEVWAEREDAEQQLRDAGVFAWPALALGAVSPNPEISVRSRRLLVPALAFQKDIEAAAILAGWVEPNEGLTEDTALRHRLARWAERFGCSAHLVQCLRPASHDEPEWWAWEWYCSLPWTVEQCRREIREQLKPK